MWLARLSMGVGPPTARRHPRHLLSKQTRCHRSTRTTQTGEHGITDASPIPKPDKPKENMPSNKGGRGLCSICSHKQHEAIDRELAGGVSMAQIAARYSVTESSLRR